MMPSLHSYLEASARDRHWQAGRTVRFISAPGRRRPNEGVSERARPARPNMITLQAAQEAHMHMASLLEALDALRTVLQRQRAALMSQAVRRGDSIELLLRCAHAVHHTLALWEGAAALHADGNDLGRGRLPAHIRSLAHLAAELHPPLAQIWRDMKARFERPVAATPAADDLALDQIEHALVGVQDVHETLEAFRQDFVGVLLAAAAPSTAGPLATIAELSRWLERCDTSPLPLGLTLHALRALLA